MSHRPRSGRVVVVLVLLLAGAGAEEERDGTRYAAGTSRHEAREGRLAHTVHVPEAFRTGKDRWPLVVALHEIGSGDDLLAADHL